MTSWLLPASCHLRRNWLRCLRYRRCNTAATGHNQGQSHTLQESVASVQSVCKQTAPMQLHCSLTVITPNTSALSAETTGNVGTHTHHSTHRTAHFANASSLLQTAYARQHTAVMLCFSHACTNFVCDVLANTPLTDSANSIEVQYSQHVIASTVSQSIIMLLVGTPTSTYWALAPCHTVNPKPQSHHHNRCRPCCCT